MYHNQKQIIMTTYISKTTTTYKNIKIVTTTTSTDVNPVAKRKTKVYVDNKVATRHDRYVAMETIDMANPKDVEFTSEQNF